MSPFSFTVANDPESAPTGSGIAELEKVFGNIEKCNQMIGSADQTTAARDLNILKIEKNDEQDSITDDSEIDCEELDET